MAGIGIRLRRILQKESLGAVVRAYVLGAAMSLGPFLSSVLCLAALSAFSANLTDQLTRQVFSGATVYVFGGSLVATGLIQVVVTRYLADEIYRGAYHALAESLFPVLIITAGLLLAVATPVLVLSTLSPLAKAILLALHMTIGLLWIVVLYATVANGHATVAIGFFAGSAIAFGAGLLLLPPFGLEGLLFGYTAGHAFILVTLIYVLVREFGLPRRWNWSVMRYVTRYPMLIAIGFGGGLAVWIDKFIFWTSDLALPAAGFTTAPKYDSSTFLGFLTAVPAIVHFFVRTEADFASRFARFFDHVFFRSAFDDIERAARELRKSVIDALSDILKVQGVITFLCAFFGIEILAALSLPVSQIGVFRYGIIGSLFVVLMMFCNVMLLYLDAQKEVLMAVIVFLLGNVAGTILSIGLGYPFYGAGFAAASFIAMLASLVQLLNQLYNLEFMTFATKPLTGQMRASPKLRARNTGGYGKYVPLGALLLLLLPTATDAQEQAKLRSKLRIGGGADSNVFRDARRETAAILRFDGLLEAEPIPDLTLGLDASVEQHLPDTGILPSFVTLTGGYRLEIDDRLSLTFGAAADLSRDLNVAPQGRLTASTAKILNVYGARSRAAIQLALNRFDIEAALGGGASQVDQPEEPHTPLFGEGSAAVRFVLAPVSVRARYNYRITSIDGLLRRDAAGMAEGDGIQLGVQTLEAGVRTSPTVGLDGFARYAWSSVSDDHKQFYSGDLHRVIAGGNLEHGPAVISAYGEVVYRSYPERTADLKSLTRLAAAIEAEYWIGSQFGVFVRYQVDREAVEPGGLLFIRHTFSVGPAGRLRFGKSG